MKDRFVTGALAGLVAGGVMDFVNAVNYYVLRGTTLRNLDWMSKIIYGHQPRGLIETLLTEFWHLLWTALLGVVFAYGSRALFPTEHRMVRGLAFAFAVWLAIYGVMILFKMSPLVSIPWKTSLSNFIYAMIFGLLLAYVLGRLLEPGASEERT